MIKYVIFDFGGTITDDGPFDPRPGLEALLRLADNPDAASLDELCGMWYDISGRTSEVEKARMGERVEIPLAGRLRNIFGRAGLRFSMTVAEMETVFDRYDSTRQFTPGFPEMLAAIKAAGFRTAVISNIAMCGESLAAAIDAILPGGFEFYISSADWLMCKPHPDMFISAARRAGVSPCECVYCGNELAADVGGAKAAGMFPVLYDRSSPAGMRDGFYSLDDWSRLLPALTEIIDH